MTDALKPLIKLLEQSKRGELKLAPPAAKLLPAKYTAVSPIDLYRQFRQADLAYKGQATVGISEVGWVLEIGAKDFDFSALFGTPAPLSVLSLTPKLTIGGSKSKSALLMIQRLPAKIEFIDQNDAITTWTAGQGFNVLFTTMGGAWSEKNTKKAFVWSVGFNGAVGVGLAPSAPNKLQKNEGEEDYKPFQEEQTVALGFDLLFEVGGNRSIMKLSDHNPGYYDNGGDDGLGADFAKIAAASESNRAMVELYKWLAEVTWWYFWASPEKAKKLITPEVAKELTTAKKKMVGFPGRPTIGVLSAISSALKGLGVSSAAAATSALKNILIGNISLESRQSDLQKIQRMVTDLEQKLSAEYFRLQKAFIQDDKKKIDGLVLDNDFNSILNVYITKKRLPNEEPASRLLRRQQRLACKRLKQQLDTELNVTPYNGPTKLFNAGVLNEPIIKAIMQDITIKPNPIIDGVPIQVTDAVVQELLKSFASHIRAFKHLSQFKGRVVTYQQMVNQCAVSHQRLGNYIANLEKKAGTKSPKPPPKTNSLSVASSSFLRAEHLTYVKIATRDTQVKAKLGIKGAAQLFGQTLAEAAGGIALTGQARFVTSRYRIQSVAHASRATPQELVITQETKVAYSQVNVSGGVAASLTAVHVSAGPAKESNLHGIINSIEFKSAVGYWKYPHQAGVQNVLFGRGSGVTFGFSIPTASLVKIRNFTGAKRQKAIATLAKQAFISDAALTAFLDDERCVSILQTGDGNVKSNLPPNLIFEVGYSFRDDFLKNNPFPCSINPGTNTYMIGKILANPTVKTWINTLEQNRTTPTAQQPDWIRLRSQISSSLDRSEHKFFALGIIVSTVIPYIINLRPIEKAGVETLRDVHTCFIRERTYNQLDQQQLGHQKSVPPVILITQ